MEDDYAKKLTKLSRHPFGLGETGYGPHHSPLPPLLCTCR